MQGLWETNFYNNWTCGLGFMVKNVNLCELRVGWAAFSTLRQKIPEPSKQCWAIEAGQVLCSLTHGILPLDLGSNVVDGILIDMGPPNSW